MARVFTQDTHYALAADDLALVTDFFDARSNLHRDLVSLETRYGCRDVILPLLGSRDEISRMTLSPGMTLTMVCFGIPLSDAVMMRPSQLTL